MPLAYTTYAAVIDLVGQTGVDLRTDDGADTETNLVQDAITYAAARIDFYCYRYAQADLAQNQWVADAAAFLSVYWLCKRRLNSVPESIGREWTEDRKPELELVRSGKAEVPRCPKTRRPITLTNQTIDLRRWNNNPRTDRSRSTGIAIGYIQPTDPAAPDQRT